MPSSPLTPPGFGASYQFPSLIRVRHKSERGCCAECLHYAGRNMRSHDQQQMLCRRFPQTVMKWPSDTCGEFEYHVSGR